MAQVKNANQIYGQAQQAAATAANNAAGNAAKNARAAMMEGGQGKLAAALQSSQARSDASQNAYNDNLNQAASLAASQDQAQANIDATAEENTKNRDFQKSENKKNRVSNLIGAGIGTLGMIGSMVSSDEKCKKFANRKVFS